MKWAIPFDGGYCDDTAMLKTATFELLIAGKLPERRDYVERRVFHFLIDYRYAIVAAPAVVGLLYWLFFR